MVGGSTGGGDHQLGVPTSVLVDKFGNVYVTDSANHRVMCWPPWSQGVGKPGTLIVGDHDS
ncbi:unnamed protein product, partial [Rotaria sp. Silwood2]